jgi:integrase
LCVTALKLRGQQQDTHRPHAVDHWADTGLVFTTRFGTPIGPRNFTRSFDRRIGRAKVRRITVHGTRKSCGSLLAALDVHPRVAMQIPRHSKIAVTMKVYTQVGSDDTGTTPQARRPARPSRRLLHFSAAKTFNRRAP